MDRLFCSPSLPPSYPSSSSSSISCSSHSSFSSPSGALYFFSPASCSGFSRRRPR
jgi:hypothetical protein